MQILVHQSIVITAVHAFFQSKNNGLILSCSFVVDWPDREFSLDRWLGPRTVRVHWARRRLWRRRRPRHQRRHWDGHPDCRHRHRSHCADGGAATDACGADDADGVGLRARAPVLRRRTPQRSRRTRSARPASRWPARPGSACRRWPAAWRRPVPRASDAGTWCTRARHRQSALRSGTRRGPPGVSIVRRARARTARPPHARADLTRRRARIRPPATTRPNRPWPKFSQATCRTSSSPPRLRRTR